MSTDLLPSIRAALIANAPITALLPAYLGSYPVFTRRPVPDDAPLPLIVVNPQIQSGEEDGLTDQRPALTHDIVVYGRSGVDGGIDHYRTVDDLARRVQQLFHRQRAAVSASGWTITDVTARGPFPAPVDDEQTVGRRVEVTAQLARRT